MVKQDFITVSLNKIVHDRVVGKCGKYGMSFNDMIRELLTTVDKAEVVLAAPETRGLNSVLELD